MALEHELSGLAQRMGMSDLVLSPAGVAALDISNVGRVYFERSNEDCLVYLASPFFAHDTELPRRLLSLCHYRQAHAFALSGGVHNDQVVLLTRIEEREISAAMLENAMRYLFAHMENLLRA